MRSKKCCFRPHHAAEDRQRAASFARCPVSRITEFLRYVRVDFDDCDAGELMETYRAFALVCLHKHANGALLKAGDDDPNGHHGLRDAVAAMARHSPLPYDFKLA